MDFINKVTGGDGKDNNTQQQEKRDENQSGGGFMDKLNGFAGGGQQGEKNEDGLDKGETHGSFLMQSHAA
jgi:hypothetical protein